MGIYRQGKTFWVSKCINGIQYRKSAGTESKLTAKAFYEDWVAELKEQIRTGKPILKQEPAPEQKKEITFSELASKYLEWAAGRQRGIVARRSNVKILNQSFSKMKLSQISIKDLEQFQSDLLKTGHTIAYCNKLIGVFKAMYAKALDWEFIDESVLLKARKVKQLKGENKRLRYLSDDEIERLLSNCNSYLKPIVITALNTGMRRGEILNLTWDRVDFKNRIILLDKTKNGDRREIPINKTLLNALSGIVRNIKTDYVFYNPETLKPYNEIKRSFNTALKKSHILDFHFHDLRHTFASRLVMAGVDLTTVKELMGHKDIRMTLRYSHLSQAHLKQAISALDKNYHNFIIDDENDVLSKSIKA